MQPLGAQSAQQCYHCWGLHYMAKECATPLNCPKRGVLMSLPPKIKKSKRTGISTNSTQTDSITLKAIREEYHNPDLIARLADQANETHILEDDIECLALIDSGAQIYTVMIEFIKELGLKIHQLNRILKFETIGGGDILYMGYVETNLKIPEIKASDEDILMLVIENSEYTQ